MSAFMERNLEQLANVQKQLIVQNTTLKKESVISSINGIINVIKKALSDRKLATRNDRIQTLESMLLDTQSRLENQNKKYDFHLTNLKKELSESKGSFDEQ